MRLRSLFLAALAVAVTSPAVAQESPSRVAFFIPFTQSLEYVDGLSSATLVDSTLLTPKRVSDTRSVTSLGLQGIYVPDADNTVDFGYSLHARNYFNKTDFNLVNNMLGAGYTHRLNDQNVISVRGDVNRSFAGGDYSPYYWMGHAGTALAQTYSPQVSAVYGVDLMRYVFDDSDAGGLDSTQVQLSAVPSYVFSSMPARLSVLLRGTDSTARESSNGYQSFDIVPQLTYVFSNRHVVELSTQYSRAQFDARDTIQVNTTREDQTYGASAGYILPLGKIADKDIAGTLRYSYLRNDSNLDRQDYDSSIISLGVSALF